MATKKTAKKDEEGEGRTLVAFDEGSFVRAERRALQVKYNRHFDDLLLYIDAGLVRRDVSFERDPEDPTRVYTILPPPAPEIITNVDGSPVFADDVLISMLLVIAQRDNPEATEAMFADYSTRDLLTAIRQGKAEARKTGRT